jgi:hypothetical protein
MCRLRHPPPKVLRLFGGMYAAGTGGQREICLRIYFAAAGGERLALYVLQRSHMRTISHAAKEKIELAAEDLQGKASASDWDVYLCIGAIATMNTHHLRHHSDAVKAIQQQQAMLMLACGVAYTSEVGEAFRGTCCSLNGRVLRSTKYEVLVIRTTDRLLASCRRLPRPSIAWLLPKLKMNSCGIK